MSKTRRSEITTETAPVATPAVIQPAAAPKPKRSDDTLVSPLEEYWIGRLPAGPLRSAVANGTFPAEALDLFSLGHPEPRPPGPFPK